MISVNIKPVITIVRHWLVGTRDKNELSFLCYHGLHKGLQ